MLSKNLNGCRGRHLRSNDGFNQEINQPLFAIVAHGNAAVMAGTQMTLILTKRKKLWQRIVDDGLRAAELITSIRGMFRKDSHEKLQLNVNDLVREVLKLIHGDLERRQIILRTELHDALPKITGERRCNRYCSTLIVNAIEAPWQCPKLAAVRFDERQMERPKPIPWDFVVKKGSKMRSMRRITNKMALSRLSASGTKRPIRNVRSSVAIGGKADVTLTSQFGGDRPVRTSRRVPRRACRRRAQSPALHAVRLPKLCRCAGYL